MDGTEWLDKIKAIKQMQRKKKQQQQHTMEQLK